MDLTDKGLRDAFTKTGYGAFKALYPVFFSFSRLFARFGENKNFF